MIQKIVIIDGNPELNETQLNLFLCELEKSLSSSGFSVIFHSLSEKEIKSCVGCWDCWWKTPGICRHKDDAPQILKDIINSDLVIFSSPMIMGMYSSLLKFFHDRIIPLLHPYIEIKEGENHHKKRYPKYPKMGIILENGDSSIEEIENVKYIFKRMALNFHSEVKFFKLINQTNPKEISHEISHI